MDAGAIRDSYTSSLIRTSRADGGYTPPPAPSSDDNSWPGQATSTDKADHTASLRSLAGADSTQVQQEYERDPDTKTLVYKAIDSATGTVLVQLPDESMLRMRAYLQSLQPQVSESTLTKSV